MKTTNQLQKGVYVDLNIREMETSCHHLENKSTY